MSGYDHMVVLREVTGGGWTCCLPIGQGFSGLSAGFYDIYLHVMGYYTRFHTKHKKNIWYLRIRRDEDSKVILWTRSNWDSRGGGEGGGKEKKEEGKKHSRLNQKERRLTNATFKSTEALPGLILYAKVIYGVKICEGTMEEGHKRES